jgi:DNA invertase Pin-like site-specific DNA recombinase
MGIMGIYVRTSVETDGTSIEQQKKIGVNFCKSNKFEYQIYEDIGKSGFKIEDEENPFKNRQGLTRLIDDIEKKIIDKVWVYEHSRLSRNQQSSFILNRIFQKHNITVYEKDKQFDMNDPQNQMIQGILTQISQYERHLITNRTTRGVHDYINRGIRVYNNIYGYKKDGINDDGYVKWIPVKSEIENIRYSYQEYLKGKSINIIVTEIYKKLTGKERSTKVNKWTRILRHFENTGYSLNTEGLEILNKFKKFEIDNIEELNNPKYYTKSIHYPINIVSIKNWIKVVDKLQKNKIVYKDKMRRTDTEMMTGIVQCPYCELRYYYSNDKNYRYYKHYPKSSCGQRPKSLGIEKLNKLSEVFFFYFYLVYDDTKNLIEESQKILKLNSFEIKDKIKTVETENRKIERQIDRFQNIYEETNDKELLKLTLKKESELNIKLENNKIVATKLKTELEELNKKYNQDELELTYFNVKETVIKFFEKMTVEEKRMSLVKIIKNCQLFNKYIVFDTGKLLFIFNIKEEYNLTDNVYNKFKRDITYKDNFLNSSKVVDDEGYLSNQLLEFIVKSKKEMKEKYTTKQIDKFSQNVVNYFISRVLGDISIDEYYLTDKDDVEIKSIMKKKLNELSIKYDLSNIEKIISFTKL